MKSVSYYLLLVGCALCTCVGLGNAAETDEGYAVLSDGIAHDRLFAVDFRGDYGVAVGEVGQVAVTDDGGKSWTQEKAPTDLALLGVSVSDTRTVAVGQEGLILLRERGGEWKKVDAGAKERLLQVDLNNNGLAYIVGGFGTVLRSTDGGDSWSPDAPDWKTISDFEDNDELANAAMLEPTMYTVQVTENDMVILAGEVGYIVYSSDAGKSWKLGHRGENTSEVISPSVFDLEIRNDGIGVAAGQSGLLMTTKDFGASWTKIKSPTQANLFGITMLGKQAVVAGMRVMMVSHDEGASWSVLKGLDLTTQWYADVVPAGSENSVIAVGHAGRIIRVPLQSSLQASQ